MSQQLIEKIVSNSATPAEKLQFEEWLNASSKNRDYFAKTKAIWDSLDDAFQTKKFEKATARVNLNLRISAAKSKAISTKRYRQLAFAASVLILVGISFIVGNRVKNGNQFNQIYSANNSVLEVELTDSTRVWLNKNSTLKLHGNFSRNNRTVTLKGEAYFEVKRDEAKPFKVIAGNTLTKVMGTSFNIHQDTLSGDVDLDVKTGRVVFSQTKWRAEEITLLADEHACYKFSDKKIAKLNETDLNYLAWKTGVLIFDKTPLIQVCTDLSKYYGVNVESADENRRLELTGNFRNEQLENILSSIAITLEVKINQQGQNYIIEPY